MYRHSKTVIGLIASVAMVVSLVPQAFAVSVSYPDLECRPDRQTVESGERITLRAVYDYSPHDPYEDLTWRAVGGSPSSGTGRTFDTRFYTDVIDETHHVTVTDGYRTATCVVRVEGEREEDLTISPEHTTVNDGELVTFRARGGDGRYRWDSDHPNGDDGATGSYWSIRFDNNSNRTKTYEVTVRSDGQRETARITVRPDSYYYPTPTPTPYGGRLQCYPSTVSAVSGEEVILRAWGGDGTYRWSNVSAYPSTAYGAHYSTRFTNNSNFVRSFIVSVTSGWETSVCQVNVSPHTTYYPTWTPTPYPPVGGYNPSAYNDDVSLSQGARNVSEGDIALTTSVRAKGNDTIQFSIVVRNTSDGRLRDVRLTDILPSGLQYVWNSTTRDGRVIRDGITTRGIDLGNLERGESTTVQFSVMVDGLYVPSYGSRTIYNTAQVRADDTDTEISRLPVVLSEHGAIGTLGTASTVQTGAADTALVALAVAMAVTGLYAVYAGSARFDRRYALASIQKLQRDKNRLNFARLV